jgi:hypothetical protein
LAMARDLQNLTTQMWLLLVFSTYYLGRGNWADAERSLEELIEIARRQGGGRRLRDGLHHLSRGPG